jgi:hypothetical protein
MCHRLSVCVPKVSCRRALSFPSSCLCPDLALDYAELMAALPSADSRLCSQPVHLIARRLSSHRHTLSVTGSHLRSHLSHLCYYSLFFTFAFSPFPLGPTTLSVSLSNVTHIQLLKVVRTQHTELISLFNREETV